MEKIFLVKPRQSGKSTLCLNYTELYPDSVVISPIIDEHKKDNQIISIKSFITGNYKKSIVNTVIIDDYLFIDYSERVNLHKFIENNKNITKIIIVSTLNGPICNKEHYVLVKTLKQNILPEQFFTTICDLQSYNRDLANNLLNIYHNYMTDGDINIIFSNDNLCSPEKLELLKQTSTTKEYNNQYLNKFDE